MPIIHFAHANGFPASSYQAVFDQLPESYQVVAHEMFGHNPQFPIENNWTSSVQELIEYLEKQPEPVIGVGHSFGGMLTFLTALERSDLFKGLILLDTLVLRWYERAGLKLAKKWGWVDKITPAGRTAGRKAYWRSHDEAINYLKPKSLFKGVDPVCLKDYVEKGTIVNQDGVRLKFEPEIELAVFRTFPDQSLPKKKLTMPVQYVRGKDSDVVMPRHLRSVRRKYGMKTLTVPGGHLFPFQYPKQTANLIRRFVDEQIVDSQFQK